MGLENEIAVGIVPAPDAGRRTVIAKAIVENIPSTIPCVRTGEPVQDGVGFFLANGGKIYVDAGYYVETASPEVTDPLDAVAYQRAGELHLLSALSRTCSLLKLPPEGISLLRASTD